MKSVRTDVCSRDLEAPDRGDAITALALASRRGMPSGFSRRVLVKINGEVHYLWRAVDHEGEVLEAVVTKRWDKAAALKLLKKLLERHGQPASIITHKLRSYGAALSEFGSIEHQTDGRRINNRAKNSHLPLRRRERAMLRFRRMRSLLKFASIHSSVHKHPSGQARGQASISNVTSTSGTTSKKPNRCPHRVAATAGCLNHATSANRRRCRIRLTTPPFPGFDRISRKT